MADQGKVLSAVSAYADAVADEKVAPVLAELAQAKAETAGVQAAFDDYRAQHPDSPAAPRMAIGWSAVDVARATQFAGKPAATRGPFYTALPASYDGTAPRMVPGAKLRFVSFTVANANLESYCKSVPDTDTVCLAYVHEVENGKSGTYNGTARNYTGNGAAYVADYTKIYDRVKAANRKVQVGMVSASWAYRPSQTDSSILAGAFLPPAGKVDFYAVDTYQEGTLNLQPLESHTKFQNWYKLVKDRGVSLGITEYGLQLLKPVSQDPFVTAESAPGESAARAKVIPLDQAWLQRAGFKFWLYWYYSHSTSGDPTALTREFTDAGSVDAWGAVVAANAG